MSRPIIYIHTTDLGKNDTSTTFVVFNALSLAETGVKVYLLLMNSSDHDATKIVKNFTRLDHLPDTLIIKSFQLKRKSKFPFYLFVRSFVRSFDRSALVLNSAHGVIPYLFFLKDRRHSYLVETHDFFYDLSIRDDAGKKSWLKKSRIERKYFHRFDGMICLNEHQAKLYRERIPDIPIGIFPTGIYELPELTKARMNRVVYIGSLDWRMGTDHLISLIKIWPKDIELVILGGKSEEEKKAFEKKAGGLPDNVKITGWITKDNMHDILEEASLALMPHQDVFFSRYMTVPLKMFDYFAYGLPILASDLPTIRDWVEEGEHGFFVSWDDSDQVMKLIVELISDENKVAEMSNLIREKAGDMLWKKRALNQLKYFKEESWI